MKWKIAAFGAFLAFLLLLLVFFLYVRLGERFGIRRYDSAAVVTQVKRLNELVTVRYTIQRVVGLKEPKQPFGEESLLIMVQGEAFAGVNLAEMKPDAVAYTGPETVNVDLPPPKLLHTYIDEKQTKVWDRSITWWTPWVAPDPDLEHKARLSALQDLQNAALTMGILSAAQKNAQLAIADLLAAFNLKATFKVQPT